MKAGGAPDRTTRGCNPVDHGRADIYHNMLTVLGPFLQHIDVNAVRDVGSRVHHGERLFARGAERHPKLMATFIGCLESVAKRKQRGERTVVRRGGRRQAVGARESDRAGVARHHLIGGIESLDQATRPPPPSVSP